MRFVAILAALLAAAGMAVAQGTVVSLEPTADLLSPYVRDIMTVVVIPFIIVPLVVQGMRKLGLDIEAQHRDALQTSLTNAAGLLVERARKSVAGVTVDVRNASMAEAIRYVQESAPDAVKKFGLSSDAIAKKIAAKIPQIEGPKA